MRLRDQMEEIKKGPWKAEEDEVLNNHVKKYGPRDWSSIRSKGLLQRTGKSCRLRWVNKLRPNLKSGVKFSLDEERTVIELQAQFGNKWARIATHLPGRTDNDVKNFWSSRRKRLARILPTPTSSRQQSKSQKSFQESSSICSISTCEAPKHMSTTDEDPSILSSREVCCSTSYELNNYEPIKMVLLPEPMNPTTTTTTFLSFEQNQPLLQFENTHTCMEKKSSNKPEQPPTLQTFPLVSLPQAEHSPPFVLESHELFTQLGDPNFFEFNGQGSASEIIQLPYISPGTVGKSDGNSGNPESDNSFVITPDTFIDDFPTDIFDHFDEPLPSPSDW